MSDNDKNLKNTPLYNKHVEAGAKMVPFAGWNMPVQYTGIIEEHMHTRTKAGLFDICHMGEFFFRGPSAEQEVDRLVTCCIDDMDAGKCKYGFLLNENGGIIDDLIVSKISSDEFMIVVNAGCVEKDKRWIQGKISSPDIFTDKSEGIAKLDIQGPLSGKIMGSLVEEKAVEELGRFCCVYVELNGIKILLSRTGYTGELGYELYFPIQFAKKIWDMIIEFDEVKPVGLGARDTLRLEKGYSLYGNDIDEKHTPFESNLAGFVFMRKNFIGKEALLKQQTEGINQLLMGFVCDGRRSARSHFRVMAQARDIGEVTSGGFSPCLKKGIGLCYINKEFAEGNQEIILMKGKVEIKANIKQMPVV